MAIQLFIYFYVLNQINDFFIFWLGIVLTKVKLGFILILFLEFPSILYVL